nr:hypothetical protein [Tanacetum cinerariifolium]
VADADQREIFDGVVVSQLDLGQGEFMAAPVSVVEYQAVVHAVKACGKRRDPACADDVLIVGIQRGTVSPRPLDSKRPRQTEIGVCDRFRAHRIADAVNRRVADAVFLRVGPAFGSGFMLDNAQSAFTPTTLGL